MSQPQIDSQFDLANYNPIITVEDSQEAQEGESGPALATGDPASISAIGDTGASYYGEFVLVLACKSDFLRCRCQQCKREGDSKGKGQNEATKCQLK